VADSRSRAKNRRLNLIGETRWWAKAAALSKIFGHFGEPTGCLFVELVETLSEIAKEPSTSPEAKYKALGLVEGLCKFETVLTAQLFLKIFDSTTPLSKYLQAKDVNLMAAYSMVEATTTSLEKMRLAFDDVKHAADRFVDYVESKLPDDSDLQLQRSIPARRTRRKRKQFEYEGLMIVRMWSP
jgi:hypothetical protein